MTFLEADFPVFWERAHGANVVDVDGNVYVDLTAAFGVAAIGHGHPDVVDAIGRQAGRLVHGMGDIHPAEVKVRLLERLADLAPWERARCVLASTGSEAVEIALKTAELRTGRSGLLAFEGAYHGLTLGALAATHRSHFREHFERRLAGGVRFAPFPTDAEAVGSALAEVEASFEDSQTPVGAVLLEPIQGRGGVRIPAPGFVHGVVERARAAGAVVIFDEIFTGFGRTGRLWAHAWEGVVPDILCIGKPLGGGMPISACVGSYDAMEAWPLSEGEAVHTSTFLGHPLACAAALQFLDLLEGTGLVERSERMGLTFLGALRDRLGSSPAVREVRGRGMLIGIELTRAGLRRARGGGGFMSQLLRRGFIVLAAGADGEVVELSPPILLGEAQMAATVEALGAVLEG